MYQDMLKKELQEYATERGVSAEGTKSEIIERLEAQDQLNETAAESEAGPLMEYTADELDDVAAALDDEPEHVVDGADRPEGVVTAASMQPLDAPADEPKGATAKPRDGKLLVKMVKRAKSHSFGKYEFTRFHPFVLVPEELALQIISNPGFRAATAAEAMEFYQ